MGERAVTKRKIGPWRWERVDGVWFTSSPHKKHGVVRWNCRKEDGCWLLRADGHKFLAICPTLLQASGIVAQSAESFGSEVPS